MPVRLLTPLILLLASSQGLAEFDYSSYRPAAFADIKSAHTDTLLAASRNNRPVVSGTTFKYRLPVVFSRELRKLSAANKAVMQAWQDSLRVPEEFVQLYQHEFKVVFGDEAYWIPVQEALLLPMSSELHPGDPFELYLILIGAVDNELVFLATEFRSDRAPR